MVSIKDIAKKCNVSVATVSKALNDQADISEATKEKIRRVAKSMGYATNASARALKTNRTYNFGVLFGDERSGLSHEYFSMILESMRKEAEKYGYDITFINRAVAGQQTSYLRHAEYRCLDGIVIMTADFTDPEIVELCSSSIPIVCIDYVFENCSAVLSDNTQGMEDIVRYAYNMGHRKIAYIYGDSTNVTTSRMSSFFTTCHRLHLDIPDEYVVKGSYHDIRVCYDKTNEILKMKDRPSLIIFPDDYSYIGGLKAINEHGLNIPDDVSAIGYDGINMAKIMKVTTYEQNTEAIGSMAVRKLLQMIMQPELPVERVLISGKMLEGSTVKKI